MWVSIYLPECLSVSIYFLLFMSTCASCANIHFKAKDERSENWKLLQVLCVADNLCLVGSWNTCTECPPSFKTRGCLQIGCLALYFTLQICPCLHLLLTDNGYYGLPRLTTQVTNQNLQGVGVKDEKEEALAVRDWSEYDLFWSQIWEALSVEISQKGNWSEVRKQFYFQCLPEGIRTISASGSSSRLLSCHIQTQAVNTR